MTRGLGPWGLIGRSRLFGLFANCLGVVISEYGLREGRRFILVNITTADTSLLNVYNNIMGVFENRFGTLLDGNVFDLA